MAHAVTWFQIQGQDANGLQAFYKEVFGWKMAPSPDGGGMAMVAREKGGIDGGIGPTMDGSPRGVSVYVSTDDLDGTIAKIEAAGGRRGMPNTELPAGMGSIAGFVDPAGNWIGLWAPGKSAAAAMPKADKKARKKAAKSDKKSKKKRDKDAKKKGKKGKGKEG